jgi:hypothetical protein
MIEAPLPVECAARPPHEGAAHLAREGAADGAAPDEGDVARFLSALDGDGRPSGDGQGGSGDSGAGAGGQGGEGGRPRDDEHRAPAEDAPAAAVLPGIFGLFQARPADPAPAAAPAPAPAPAATPAAAAARTRQLVADVAAAIHAAPGAREVRVQVRPEVLPGVAFSVRQDAGRWVVDFDVSDHASAALLQSAGERMGAELARRLGRGVELRVTPTAGADGRLGLPRRFVHRADPEPDQDQGEPR